MKKLLLSAAAFAVVAVSAITVAPTTSEAIPAFARQTGAACLSCHFQRIPKLSAFGRNFKMGAYRDMGEGALLEDDGLSLPVAFNATMLFKLQIRNRSGFVTDGLNPAKSLGISYPEEAAFLTGGRVGEHVGAFTEWNGGPLSYKAYYAMDTDAGTAALGVYSSDALGMGWAMQDPSNTITRNTRASQYRPNYMRNYMHNGVTGIGAYGHFNDMVYVGVSAVVPNAGTNPAGIFVALDPSFYARAALTTELGGFDTVFGFYYAGGTNSIVNLNLVNAPAPAVAGTLDSFSQWGLDLQLQGDLGDVSVGLYANYQGSGENPYNVTGTLMEDRTGYFVTTDIAFGHLGVRLGYAQEDTDTGPTVTRDTSTFILGGWWSLAQNVELDLEYQNAKDNLPLGTTTNTTTLLLEYAY